LRGRTEAEADSLALAVRLLRDARTRLRARSVSVSAFHNGSAQQRQPEGDKAERGVPSDLQFPARADRAARIHGTGGGYQAGRNVRLAVRRAGPFQHDVPAMVRGSRVLRNRDRRARSRRDHVDRHGESVHTQYLSRILPARRNASPGSTYGKGSVAGRQVRCTRIHPSVGERKTGSDQLPAAWWRLDTADV